MEVHLMVVHLSGGLWKGQAVRTCSMNMLRGTTDWNPGGMASVLRVHMARIGILLGLVRYC